MQRNLNELQRAIGYEFTDRKLLARALTHYSHVYQEQGPDAPRNIGGDNQQLEFLGDAVLGMVVSDLVFTNFPNHSEGKLHLLKARLVSEMHLFEVARRLELGSYLFLGRGEELSGGRHRRAMLADALEALIAAIYLDAGMAAALAFVTEHVIGDISGEVQTDYKTSLLTIAREKELPMPIYSVVAETGPAHARMFTVEVRLGERVLGPGRGVLKEERFSGRGQGGGGSVPGTRIE